MLATLLLGVAAGLAVAHAEPYVGRMAAAALKHEARLDPRDLRALTLLLLMGAAAIVASALGADTSAFAAVLGAGLGHFGPALYRFARDPSQSAVGGDRRGGARGATDAGGARDDDATLRSVSDALAASGPSEDDRSEEARSEDDRAGTDRAEDDAKERRE